MRHLSRAIALTAAATLTLSACASGADEPAAEGSAPSGGGSTEFEAKDP